MTDNERRIISDDNVTVTLSLTRYVDNVIEQTINRVVPITVKQAIMDFQKLCPTAILHEQIVADHKWTEKLKVKIAMCIGIAIGSGVLGGTVSAAVIKLLSR